MMSEIDKIFPLVTIVIPTYERTYLVIRAVQSVLAQTLQRIEIIVVIDGSDKSTYHALEALNEHRLHIVELPISRGGAGARHAGVCEAQTEWIAFLDDDDEWLPYKLEKQLQTAQSSCYRLPIVTCYVTGTTPKGQFVWPKRPLKPLEPVSEYLLARSTLFHGEGMIQTSTLFVKKELLQTIPFKTDLQRHHEWDWLIRASAISDVGIEFVPESLVIWYTEEERKSVSSKNNWQYSLHWIQELHASVTPRAYAAFIMTVVGAIAAREGDRQAFWPLFREAVLRGRPKLIDFALYMGMWLIPQDGRRRIRASVQDMRNRMVKSHKTAA
jgi:glycosyltransferase involved in cell wall biosynthesis